MRLERRRESPARRFYLGELSGSRRLAAHSERSLLRSPSVRNWRNPGNRRGYNMRTDHHRRLASAAQRRRADWLELQARIESIRPKTDDERVAVAECLHLIRQAETADVSQHPSCG